MNAKPWSGLAVLLSITALVVAGLAWRSVQSLQVTAPDALQTIAALLVERETAVKQLQAPPFAEGSSGIIESYLIRLRRDGAASSAEFKRRLDRLAENTTALETLLELSAGSSKSAAFRTEAARFKSYAIAWRDRWNAVPELFMAGGNLPAAEVPFPAALVAAVQDELRAAR